MRIILACGGTGGHIYPALAIADTIKIRNPEAQILFIGTEKGMENEIVPAHGYRIKTIPASGLYRKKIYKNFKTIRNTFAGLSESKKIIEEFKPDLVFGTGGYVCGPVVYQAARLGIKTAIHEQNALPGMTNKILSRYVNKVFISFADSEKYFSDKKKLIFSGNPLRRDFVMSDKDFEKERLGVSPSDLVVLCFGGSLGSPRLNELMLKVIEIFNGVDNLTFFFVTGRNHYKKTLKKIEEKNIQIKDNIKIFEYINSMPRYISAADIVISRAGAITVAELMACGKPAILIPSPNVTGNHQFFNAKIMADSGAAILIEEKDLDDSAIISAISKFQNKRSLLTDMAEKSRTLARLDAADVIYTNIREFIENKE